MRILKTFKCKNVKKASLRFIKAKNRRTAEFDMKNFIRICSSTTIVSKYDIAYGLGQQHKHVYDSTARIRLHLTSIISVLFNAAAYQVKKCLVSMKS